MGCAQGRGHLCTQRKFDGYQNDAFTQKQQELVVNIFNTIDTDGGGMVDDREILAVYKKKSQDLKGDLDEFVALLESAQGLTQCHIIDIEAWGDTMVKCKAEKRNQFDSFLGILCRKIQDASGSSFHIGERANFPEEEKALMGEFFRVVDVDEEGKWKTNTIVNKLGREREVNQIFQQLRLEGEVTIRSFVKACWGYKQDKTKSLELFDFLLASLQQIRAAKEQHYEAKEEG
mmetsp:Transcript_3993/g.5739  ORF Transcript_3993/g.5739 Transcript_3993/m.5739 type:complete len:232 (+) Transcript_3993:190-885(+)|eukprot:CAMPEP_0184478718 /NCGR_PEP_ID=MMETSP0113_2-20130426/660_1 /TAXON_ID=91329 /ORGANISM="Norrisiella sphaerica, Strain BC52" /LENGTH=231 /DNA_ID=CAMNT_0026856605 /DNA_START=182 /DNA_END=877 /DNA_ORIENTATION=+